MGKNSGPAIDARENSICWIYLSEWSGYVLLLRSSQTEDHPFGSGEEQRPIGVPAAVVYRKGPSAFVANKEKPRQRRKDYGEYPRMGGWKMEGRESIYDAGRRRVGRPDFDRILWQLALDK